MKNKQSYFASSNSMLGFQSYFDKIYNPENFKRIYIIKGGPGTGKSGLIRYIGEKFEGTRKCEYFLCSSDPDSFDGLIIDDQAAIIDGTAPHATEARYPGVVEILLDNGKGIKESISKKRDIIFTLTEEKSKLYKSAYALLKSAGDIKKQIIKNVEPNINSEKLDSAINRFFKQNFSKNNKYSEKIRLIEGITPKGIYHSHSFEKISSNKVIIVNSKGCEDIVYRKFWDKAKEYGIKTYVSFDPLIPYSPNALYFEDYSACIVNYDKKEHGELNYDEYKVFNCDRFIDKSLQSKNRTKMRFAEKCMNSLIGEAITYLGEAATTHRELEKLYTHHTDYSYVDENTEKVLKEIESI